MGREIILNSIIDSLETILSLVANINSNKNIIPQIDIDLLKEHVRKLYQEVHNLDEANQRWKYEPRKIRDEKIIDREEKTVLHEESEHTTKKQSVKETVEEPKVHVKKEEEQEKVITHQITKEETEETREFPEKPISETKEEIPELEAPKADKPIEKKPVLFDEPISVADKFANKEKSINEKLSEGSNKNTLYQSVSKSPISNLKTAIGINDKFMFVNELFQGDMKNYDAFIRQINEMNDGTTALNAYIQKLNTLGADAESSAALKLREYIERRFL